MNSKESQASQGDLRAPPMKLAYSVNEACQALSLSRTTVYEMIADKRLRSFKVGVKTLIPADSLQRLVASLEMEAA
ncbi:DNA binding domain-containing protein, excisionase family [Methylobacterium sp. 190mf]|uniref:helix-turn-helix domain-containing protein n=1 Tax=Methylobacterium sp. 190mf TaxID=1761798 RepID=UPI00089EF8CD|nr:helix-turn-helix domain-containing protein [Methylobacterium sp. 190mf]SEF41020.1 DNA binding domain-containing protein, excisionase family [Methylobacterium sp. 190mf]